MNHIKKTNFKKSNLIIVISIVILIVAIAILSLINRNMMRLPDSGDGLLLFSGNKTIKEYTLNDIKNLPHIDVTKSIASGKHEDESGVFTGVPLETLLSDAASDWQGKYTEFIFKAEDGFTSSAFASDIEKGENVLVVYAKDGKPLKTKADGGNGPLRIVIVQDEFGNRSTYYLKSIELKK
ncbi:MAG: molybdopterin-dependent oxidoreductase [Clostridiales Family XIII bacterium]|jgi:hypothetical protein|nr:molybdopterin-dependent oxidoreductase [Clostridiales Family XIII bacterium]